MFAVFFFCVALCWRAGKKETSSVWIRGNIIYGVLKFMFHSSCSKSREKEASENVVHDGKTKAKEQKHERTKEKLIKWSFLYCHMAPSGTAAAASHESSGTHPAIKDFTLLCVIKTVFLVWSLYSHTGLAFRVKTGGRENIRSDLFMLDEKFLTMAMLGSWTRMRSRK